MANCEDLYCKGARTTIHELGARQVVELGAINHGDFLLVEMASCLKNRILGVTISCNILATVWLQQDRKKKCLVVWDMFICSISWEFQNHN